MYKIRLHREVGKEFRKLRKGDRSYAEKIQKAIQALAENPRPHGYTKLDENLFRIRQGNYRIIYAIYDNLLIVVVLALRKRDEQTYARLEQLLERARLERDRSD